MDLQKDISEQGVEQRSGEVFKGGEGVNAITCTTRKQNILGILEDNKDGLTAEEIANELFERGNVPYVDKKFVSPRLTEMLHSGEVNVCGSRLSAITNRNTAVWKATNA